MFKKSVQQQLLSYHCLGTRKQLKNNKLNLFGKAIVVIDKIKEVETLASIRQLDLSHNGISQIQNIEQFVNVEFINLSHNRIIEAEQILKLQKLMRLNTLYLKGNPFLREIKSQKVIAFLLSINTDIDIVSPEVAQLINAYSSKAFQNLCYSDYLRKIQNHIQLVNNYQVDESFINPDYAIFPKIKKILEESTLDLSIKRQLIQNVDERCFQDEGIISEYFKRKVEQAENQRSQIIRKVYEREQLLRNVRSTYHQKVIPKKVVPRAMNGTTIIGYFSPPKLKQSKKQAKIQNIKPPSKSNNKYDNRENFSPHKISQSSEWKEGYNEQILMNILIKMNPLYHLLHSPLPSLKSHQKQLLIQNLTLHLKQKLKQLLNYEKKDNQYITTREEMNDLQEHLKEVSAQFKNQQNKAHEKLKKLSSICKQESQRVQNLCEQLNQYEQELNILKSQNDRIKGQNSHLKQKLALFQSQQDLQQAIKDHFSKNLKKKYLLMICKKAYHSNQLKLFHELNKKVDQKILKQDYLQNMITFMYLSKHEKKLSFLLKKKNFQEMRNMIKTVKGNHKKQQLLSHQLLMKQQIGFIQLLKVRYDRMSLKREKITKMKKKFQKIIKCRIFDILKQNLQESYQSIKNEEIQKESTILTLRKIFKTWKRYLVQHESRSSRCKTLVTRLTKHYYLNIFIDKSRENLRFIASKQATADFLEKMRKIKSYINFTKSTSSVLFQRSLKRRKIELYRQHQYLFQFFSTIRDSKVQKKILVERQLHKKKQSEEERLKQEFVDKKIKLNKMLIFKGKIGNCSKKIIRKILNREKQSLLLLSQKQSGFYKAFLINLRSSWINNLKISTKVQLLRKSPIIANKMKEFFQLFSMTKSKTSNFVKKLNNQTLMKCFYRWKFYNSWSKMESYKHMYEQLEPEISYVSKLQRQIGKEKQLLMLEIQQKDRIVRDFQKKCEQYEYILHSKDLKYEKLKDIYAETMSQQELSTTIKPNLRERSSQQDIYLKYLPHELRHTPPTKYSFQAKIREQDGYLKGRLYTNAENLKTQLAKDTQKRAPYLKNRETFLSSFKRF